MEEINGYDLSRAWFDFCFENPEKVTSNHTAIYFFAIEHCNRLGWKKKFGLPTSMVMEAVGIKSYNTYIKCFRDLVSWSFIKLIKKSQNQYSSNIIALSNFDKSLDKSLDKALIKHSTKQSESTVQSIDSIIKQLTKNKEQVNKEQYKGLASLVLEIKKMVFEEKKKVPPKKENNDPVLPWDNPNFRAQWDHWKIYKAKEFGFKYKTIQSEQAALAKLRNMAENEKAAIAIIHQSMAHGWKGFFEIKSNQNKQIKFETNR